MNKILSFIFLIAFVTSCSLDTKPSLSIDVDQLTPGDAETLTLGTYSYMKKDNGILRAFHYIGEYGGENVSLSGSTTDVLLNIYDYIRLTNNSRVANIWSYSYKTIININGTLEVATEGVSKEGDIVIGENYFLRAYHYYALVTTFGATYANDPENNLGVPIKLTTSLDDFPARATVKEVYEQIESDLLKAVELMTIATGSTITPKNNCYASAEVAMALLSRIYLYMEQWDKAEEYATKVIDSGRYQLVTGETYKAYPTYVPEANIETVFAVRYTKDIDLVSGYMIGSMYAKIDDRGWGEMYPSDSYLKLLELHPDDLRNAFIKKQSLNNGTYWFIYNKDNTYVTVPVTLSDGTYTVTETESEYTTTTVQTEAYHGGTAYYLTATDGTKYYGRVEEQVELRNDWPKYFIYKCSLQEEQPELWSPVIIRLAEMYLNRAEARYHLGDESGALEDINVIRTRATIPSWTTANIPTGYTVLDLVLEERRLELAFEGQNRMDIFRNRKSVDRNYPGAHIKVSGSPLTISYDALVAVEYIPQSEIDAYPNKDLLIQNP